MGVSLQSMAVGLVVVAALLQLGSAQINPACTERLDLLIVFDSSGSVNFNNFYNWDNAKRITEIFLRNFTIAPDRVHVGILMVADDTRVELTFDRGNNLGLVINTVRNLQIRGGRTNLATALQTAREQFFNNVRPDRENVQNVLLLLSDGRPTLRIPETIPEADRLKQNTLIVTVAISGNPDTETLRRISSSPDQPMVTFDQIYITQNFLTTQELDLCILMDSSGSIIFLDINNWYYAKLFLEYLVNSLQIDRGRTRVSAITFNETAVVQFSLTTFRDTLNTVRAIRSLQYSGGRTNLAAAFRLARTTVFTEPSRPNRKRVALVITDGMPTDEPGNVEVEANNLKAMGVDIISVVVQAQGQRQIDRERLLRLASIVSSNGINLKPAIMEVTNYRALGSNVGSVVDRICSIPVGRTPQDDLRVQCFRSCRDETRGNTLLRPGNYHYCPLGRIRSEQDCVNYIYCDQRARMIMVGCPPGTMFDDSLKACTWKSCSCPGGTRRCFRPFPVRFPGRVGRR